MDKNLDIVFQNFLSGEMSPEEKSEFEVKLAQDPDFKIAFDNYRLGIIAGERVHYNELKKTVSSIIVEENIKAGEEKIVKKSNYRIYAYAAVFILLCTVILYFLFKPNQTPEALYAANYSPPPYSTSRSAEVDDEELEEVILNFSASNWSEAIRLINELDENQKNERVIQRILAHSLLNSNQVEEAISVLKRLISNSPSSNVLEDQWNIGLAYLKISELDSSLVYITKIRDGNANFENYEKADNLIPKIQRLNR